MDTPDAAKHQNFDIQGKFPYDAIIIGPGDEKYKIAKSGMSLFGKTITILKWSTAEQKFVEFAKIAYELKEDILVPTLKSGSPGVTLEPGYFSGWDITFFGDKFSVDANGELNERFIRPPFGSTVAWLVDGEDGFPGLLRVNNQVIHLLDQIVYSFTCIEGALKRFPKQDRRCAAVATAAAL